MTALQTPALDGQRHRLRSLGPGLIMAAAAVGASHLVASTQAGALFGWQLLWLIVLVNVLKYPFFRFGVQYTLSRNESLIEGYRRKGRGWLIAFTGLNLLAAIVNTAGVLLLTANLLAFFLPGSISVTLLCVLLLAVCLAILLAGHYRMLDSVAKVIMLLLTVATILAVIIAWQSGTSAPVGFEGPSPWELSALAFLVAMIGWMPVPIELSAINSMWLRSKQRLLNISLQDGLFDFNLGYWVAAGLAFILFFQSALSPMLTFAMTLAFITTPFFAWLNFSLVRGEPMPIGIRWLAWAGIIYLGLFSVFYVVWWLTAGGG